MAMLLAVTAATSSYAPVNGLSLYYEVHGQSRPGIVPLVLLHGGGSTIETSFGKLLPLLSKDRQVIAFEQQGHGHTADIRDRPFSFTQSADDAAALLRHLEVEKADFFGYSNGGHIALEIALRHPGLVRALVLESMMYSRAGCDPGFWAGFEHAKLADMPRELQDAYLHTAPHPEDLPFFFRKSVERMRSFKGWTDEQVRSIRAPALVVLGDRDLVLVDHAARMQRLLPDAQLAVLPGADHMTVVARADEVAALVLQFLGRR
ncbi:MAG: alpha/beta fold hydrolase [Myxococcales bacterium]